MEKKWKKRLKILAICALCAALLTGLAFLLLRARAQQQSVSESDLVLNTVVTITIYGTQDKTVLHHCFDLCDNYELVFSRTNKNSELYQVNHTKSAQVSDTLLHVLKKAVYYCRISGGKFDITTGGLSDLYGFATEDPTVPKEKQLKEALKHVNYKNVSIQGNQVTRKDTQAEIDLGAIAKGYIADQLKVYLLKQGVNHAIINLGGNVLCVGGKPSGGDFTIGIQYPFQDVSKTITEVQVSDESVVTSGIYERYFYRDHMLYHHILDPATGEPCRNNLLAVSIVGGNSEQCDALSTVCFALGLEKGLKLINQLDDVYAVFVTDDDQLHYSDEFQEELCG